MIQKDYLSKIKLYGFQYQTNLNCTLASKVLSLLIIESGLEDMLILLDYAPDYFRKIRLKHQIGIEINCISKAINSLQDSFSLM